jgi:hypothetical protein
MSTGRWSELSAEHEVRYTENGKSFVTAMSKTSGVAEGLYGLVTGFTGPSRLLFFGPLCWCVVCDWSE